MMCCSISSTAFQLHIYLAVICFRAHDFTELQFLIITTFEICVCVEFGYMCLLLIATYAIYLPADKKYSSSLRGKCCSYCVANVENKTWR